ncbi:MAG: biopolymer transporter ExbD [Bacteroidetes bacterium]|jgi:biopolymer transport protein ExbD|nr:biopolymer transporter ExbD [Pseudomonadota bacterium]MED5444654.1 biopolymer transporter ExbD [Pseudomonadota bacterium]NBW94522.1 biopolymer transporter ExbD [Bacteroidota bacterium]
MRRSMARFSGREEKSEINLTPMLDVVFIMLIFFIVTATFIKEPGTDILRPEALTAEVKPTVSVLVGINVANEIWIDKKRVDVRSVRANLERLIAENPKGGLVVQADAGSKNELLMEVLNAARGAGIQQVAVSTEN